MRAGAALLLFLQHLYAWAAACGDASFSSSDGWHCVEINTLNFLHYIVDIDNKELRIGVHAKNHSGWTGIGINGNGGMLGASMAIVRKVNGEWMVEDRHSKSYAQPIMDVSQDVTLVSAEEQDGDITFIMGFPLNSCDDDDYPIANRLQTVLWARGPNHGFMYHGPKADVDRGALEINFFRAPETPSDPPDAITIDVRMPNVPIKGGPNGQDPSNPYVCAAFDLQALNLQASKMHVTKYEPLISAGSHPYVHHMIMNPCPGRPSYAQGSDTSTWWRLDCEAMVECSGANFVWAVGSGTVVFPPEAGFPIHAGVRYAAMQMHYYNPEAIDGLRDSSGFRLTLTASLRPQDVGILQLNGGTNPHMVTPLPPGQQEVWKYLQVPASCFDAALPAGTDEVRVLKVFHHLHEVGSKMEINLIRDDVDMGPFRNEKMYDFKHQAFVDSEFETLKRTDSLLVRCRYDTSRKTEPVDFGDLTQQEMCFGGLYYYPAVADIAANVVLQIPQVSTTPAGCVAFNGCKSADDLQLSKRRKDYICKFGMTQSMSSCEYMLRHDPYGFLSWRNQGISGRGTLLEYCKDLSDAGACKNHECTEFFNFCVDFISTCQDRNVSKCKDSDVATWANSFCTTYCGGAGSLYPDAEGVDTEIVSFHMQGYCLEGENGVSWAEQLLLENPLKLWQIAQGLQDEEALNYFSGPRWPSLESVCNEHDFNMEPFEGVTLETMTDWLQICPRTCAATKSCTTDELKAHAKIATGRICTTYGLSGFPSMYPTLTLPTSGSASPSEPTCNEVARTLTWQSRVHGKRGMKTSSCDIGNAHLCGDGVQGCVSSFRDNVLCPSFGICNGSYPMSEVCREGWTSQNGLLNFEKLASIGACMHPDEQFAGGMEGWLQQQCKACEHMEQIGKHVTECGDDEILVSQTFTPSPRPQCIPQGPGPLNRAASLAVHGHVLSAPLIMLILTLAFPSM